MGQNMSNKSLTHRQWKNKNWSDQKKEKREKKKDSSTIKKVLRSDQSSVWLLMPIALT